jgi:hypothetical protein
MYFLNLLLFKMKSAQALRQKQIGCPGYLLHFLPAFTRMAATEPVKYIDHEFRIVHCCPLLGK